MKKPGASCCLGLSNHGSPHIPRKIDTNYSWTSIIAPSKIAFTSKIAWFSEWPTFYLVKYHQKLRPHDIFLPRKLRRTFSLENRAFLGQNVSISLDFNKDLYRVEVFQSITIQFSLNLINFPAKNAHFGITFCIIFLKI